MDFDIVDEEENSFVHFQTKSFHKRQTFLNVVENRVTKYFEIFSVKRLEFQLDLSSREATKVRHPIKNPVEDKCDVYSREIRVNSFEFVRSTLKSF